MYPVGEHTAARLLRLPCFPPQSDSAARSFGRDYVGPSFPYAGNPARHHLAIVAVDFIPEMCGVSAIKIHNAALPRFVYNIVISYTCIGHRNPVILLVYIPNGSAYYYYRLCDCRCISFFSNFLLSLLREIVERVLDSWNSFANIFSLYLSQFWTYTPLSSSGPKANSTRTVIRNFGE